MQLKNVFGGLLAILLMAGLGYSAWHFVNRRSTLSCKACARPVHSHMRTVAILDGKPAVYCCPACALSAQQQSGKQVRVAELTDFLTNRPLPPESSFVVRNSDVNPCLRHQPAVSENSQPLEFRFDRCSPSVLAFKDRPAAVEFASEHGGQVLGFSEFASALQR